MPMEDWMQHWIVARFLYDWQTLAAGALAALRLCGQFVRLSDQQIEKLQPAKRRRPLRRSKWIRPFVWSVRRRVATEGYAFHATIWAAMERVLLEASVAKSIFLTKRACVTSGQVFKGGLQGLDALFQKALSLNFEANVSDMAAA